jgi:hypothetical protein
MNLELYISQLLYRHACVIVPGFGAFLSKTNTSQWLVDSNIFIPPYKQLSFNASLVSDDGLLANQISKTENVSYEYAQKVIEYQVLKWKKAINSQGFITIQNVGELILGTENQYIFQSQRRNNFLTPSFGLSELNASITQRQTKIHVVKQLSQQVEVASTIHSKPNYLKYAAVWLVGVGIIGSLAYTAYINKINSEIDLVQQTVNKQVDAKIQEATFVLPTPNILFKKQENTKLPYHIVAGVYNNLKNAHLAIANINAQGHECFLLNEMYKGNFAVVYKSFSDLDAAKLAKAEIQNDVNPEAWLLVQ